MVELQSIFDRLVETEHKWLSSPFLSNYVLDENNNVRTFEVPGRPEKTQEESSDRTKRRKISDLAEIANTELFVKAASSRASLSPGRSDLAEILELSTKEPARGKEKIQSSCSTPVRLSNEEALSLKVNCDLSDQQWQMIRNAAKSNTADIFPSLKELRSKKAECLPKDLVVTETTAKCSLQSMVDHTVSRILDMNMEELKREDSDELSGVFYFKSGFDGASSQSVYNQKFEEIDQETAIQHEETLFQTSISPLQLGMTHFSIFL